MCDRELILYAWKRYVRLVERAGARGHVFVLGVMLSPFTVAMVVSGHVFLAMLTLGVVPVVLSVGLALQCDPILKRPELDAYDDDLLREAYLSSHKDTLTTALDEELRALEEASDPVPEPPPRKRPSWWDSDAPGSWVGLRERLLWEDCDSFEAVRLIYEVIDWGVVYDISERDIDMVCDKFFENHTIRLALLTLSGRYDDPLRPALNGARIRDR